MGVSASAPQRSGLAVSRPARRCARGRPIRYKPLLFALLLLGAAAIVVPKVAHGDEKPLPFDDARLEIGYNATDGHAGLQIFGDSDAEWKRFEIFRPDGQKILDISASGVLRDFGLSELFSESSELPFSEFKKLFPAGNYRFEGETTDGRDLTSVVRFSHQILTTPVFVQPTDEGTLLVDDAVIRWQPVKGAVDYEVVVTKESDESRVMDTTMSPQRTSIRKVGSGPNFGTPLRQIDHSSCSGGPSRPVSGLPYFDHRRPS